MVIMKTEMRILK